VTVGQLYYGWADEGAEGLNKEQIIAASGALADRRQPLTRVILEACYSPPEPCFGWMEAQGIRIAFRRFPTGLDGRGRPGNFFVHVLAARPENLPPATLGRLWAAPIWRRRAPDGPPEPLDAIEDLEALELVEPPVPDEALVRATLAGHLANVARGMRSALEADDAEAVAVAATLAAVLPARFGLLAFSTREAPERAHLYDLVAGPAPAGHFNPIGRKLDAGQGWPDAADLLLAARKDALVAGAVAALAERSRTLQDFAGVLHGWAQLTRERVPGETTYTTSELQALKIALVDDRLVALLLDGDGLVRLAPAFAGGVPEATAVIRRGATAERRAQLAEALARALSDPDLALRRLGGLATQERPLAVATARVAAERWRRDGVLEQLSPQDVVRLLRLLQDAGETDETVTRLLENPRHTAAIFEDVALAPEWRGWAVARNPAMIGAGPLVRALAEQADFARVLLASAEPHVIEAVGAAIGSSPWDVAERAVRAAAVRVPPRVSDEWQWTLAQRVPDLEDRYHRMRTVLERIARPSVEAVEMLLDAYVKAVMEARWSNRELPRLPSVALRTTWTARFGAWREIADSFDSYGRSQPRRAAHAAAAFEREERIAAVETIVDQVAQRARAESEWEEMAEELRHACGVPYAELAPAMARAVSRYSPHSRATSTVTLIHWIAKSVERERLDSGTLEQPPLPSLGQLVSVRDGQDALKDLRREVNDKRLRAWLKDLLNDSGKAVKARRR
jgi:hypothetical protein